MALKKQKKYKNGTSSEYHNIASIVLTPIVAKERVVTNTPTDEERNNNPFARTEFYEREIEKYSMAIKIRSYVSEQVRRENPEAFLESFVRYKEVNKEGFSTNELFAQAYAMIKEEDEFKDAEDA